MVKIWRRCRLRLIKAFFNKCQHSFRSPVKKCHRKRSGFNGFTDQTIPFTNGTWHLQFKSRCQCIQTVIDSAPVTHDYSVKSPLVPKDLSKKFSVFTGIRTVDPVIRSHNSPRFTFFYNGLKSRKIDFPKSTFIHNGIINQAVFFLAVGGKMLHRSAHTHTLYATDPGSAQFSGQVRIFRHIFEISAAKRRTLDINGRSQYDGDILIDGLFTDGFSDCFQKFLIKRVRRSSRRREAGRFLAVSGSSSSLFRPLFSQSMGTIGHHDRRHVIHRQSLGTPEIQTGTKGSLLLHSQFIHQ